MQLEVQEYYDNFK